MTARTPREKVLAIVGAFLIFMAIAFAGKAWRDGYVFAVPTVISTVQSKPEPLPIGRPEPLTKVRPAPAKEHVAAKPTPKPTPAPVRAQAKPAKPSFNCATVRWAVATFDQATLDSMAKQHGVTAAEKAEAKKCLQ